MTELVVKICPQLFSPFATPLKCPTDTRLQASVLVRVENVRKEFLWAVPFTSFTKFHMFLTWYIVTRQRMSALCSTSFATEDQ